MARFELRIQNPTNRLVLKTMLEAEGHEAVSASPDVIFTDDFALVETADAPLVLLAHAPQIPDAVKAMRNGAYGYILLPFLPGEAGLMVTRALAALRPAVTEAPQTLHDAERAHIRAVLRACKNNQSEAAKILGIARNTLWRKIKTFDDVTHSRRRS
jgi:DNA-binding NtrC family response regulator